MGEVLDGLDEEAEEIAVSEAQHALSLDDGLWGPGLDFRCRLLTSWTCDQKGGEGVVRRTPREGGLGREKVDAGGCDSKRKKGGGGGWGKATGQKNFKRQS